MDMDKMISDYIEKYRTEIVEKLCEFIRIPGIAKFDDEKLPYGKACADSLDFCINLSKDKNLIVKNYDYYCAEAKLNSENKGKRLVIAAHSDVVPTDEDNMIYPPFEGTIVNNYVIGRGAVDNKGPLIAALYAMAFIKENNIKLNNDIRLVFGSNEECGMDDMEYYLEKAGEPDLGLAVDDDFPVSNGEKGLLRFRLGFCKTDDLEDIISFAPGQRLVHNHIKYKFKGDFIEKTNRNNEKGFLENNIKEEFFKNKNDYGIVKAICKSIDGEYLNINSCDKYSGNSVVRLISINSDNENIYLDFDVRTPITSDLNEAKEKIKTFFTNNNINFKITKVSKGYFIPDDDPILNLLTNLYNKTTNSNDKPYSIGACTYARKFKYGMIFGGGNQHEVKPFPTGHGGAHGPDEAHNIDVLMTAVKMYILGILAIDNYWSEKK